MSKLSIKKTEFFQERDLTGKTSYTKEEKEKILSEFLNSLSENLYFTSKNRETKVRENLKDGHQVTDIGQDDLSILKESLKNAVIYIGYTDGNFKYTDYLLISDGEWNIEGQTIKGSFYMKINKEGEMGKLMSSLADKIADYGERTEVESNLLKMMKRNRYILKDKAQKKYLFGKGHMVAGAQKVAVKKDLDMLFGLMQRSKSAVSSGDVTAQNFDKEVESLKYFKFIKA